MKSHGKTGSTGRGETTPLTTRAQFVGNTKFHADMRDRFKKYFSELYKTTKNTSAKKYIDSLQLNTGKGASGLADYYIKLMTHILYDEKGNRYDFASEKDMGKAKGSLQKLSALYPSLFYLGRALLLDEEPDNNDAKSVIGNMMRIKQGLYNKDAINAKASIGELFKAGAEGEVFAKDQTGGNARLQDTFMDFYERANRGTTEGLGDIIGIPNDMIDRVLHKAESPEEVGTVGKYPDIAEFAKKLRGVRDQVKNNPNKAGKEKQDMARDQIMLNQAKALFGGDKPADMGKVDAFFAAVDEYGGKDAFHSGIFAQKGNVPSLAVANIGADNFAKIVAKYKVPDLDPKAIAAIGKEGPTDSDTTQLSDAQKQELIKGILTAPSARDLNNWAKANLDKTGIKIDNETMKMIDNAVKDRFAQEDNPMKGIGRYPANELTVKKLFQKYGGYSTVGESDDVGAGFREFLKENLN